MKNFSDPGRYLREGIRQLGESYNQTHIENRRAYKFISFPYARLIIGLVGLIFVPSGLYVMSSEFHLSIKFVGLIVLSSGIVISLQFIALILSKFVGAISRLLNRVRLRNQRKD